MLAVGGAFAAGPLLAACGGGGSSDSNGNDFTFAFASDVESLDPSFPTDTNTLQVLYAMFDPLARLGRDGKYHGELAESWENPDDRTWKFHLRQGVKFHNGEPFNAEAVKFTFDRIRDPEMKSPSLPQLAPFDRVEVVDEHTVVFVTKEPYAATLKNLYGLYIVPPKYIAEKGNDGFAANPVGTGPFKFVERKKDVHLKMEANPDYWAGAPAIDNLTFRPIPESSARIAALQNGEVDWISGVEVDRVEDLKGDDKLQIQSMPGQGIYSGLNMLTFEPFKDVRVRQAINHGVNVDSIVDDLFSGLAIRVPSVLFTDTPGFDANMEPYAYDTDKAKQLLADAGYPDGFDVKLSVPLGLQSTQKFKEVAEAVQQDLSKIGVNVNIETVDSGTATEQYRSKQWQMYFYPWAGHEAGIYVQTLLQSDTRGYYYQNSEADPRIKEYMATIDPDARAGVGAEMNEFFFEDCPWLFLYQEPDIYGTRSTIDWEPNPFDFYFHPYDVKFK